MRTLMLLLVSVSALATEPKPEAVPFEQSQNQGQHQLQNQNQGQGQSQDQVATGGMSSSDNNVGISTRALAIGTTAPIPAQASDCYFPKGKLGRGFAFLWGAAQMSAVLERDPECIADLSNTRKYHLALLEAQKELDLAQAERDRAAVERMRYEREREGRQAK